jgi:hypothetical protein
LSTTQFRQPPTFTELILAGGDEKLKNSASWYRYFTQNELGTPPSNELPIVVAGSPFSYTANMKGFVIISGGTVSSVMFSRTAGVFYSTGQTSGVFPMAQNDVLSVAFTAPPSMVFVPT